MSSAVQWKQQQSLVSPVVRPKWWENQNVSGIIAEKTKQRKEEQGEGTDDADITAGSWNHLNGNSPEIIDTHAILAPKSSGPSNAWTVFVSTPGCDSSLHQEKPYII